MQSGQGFSVCLPLLLFSLALGKIEVIIRCSVVQSAVDAAGCPINWKVESHRNPGCGLLLLSVRLSLPQEKQIDLGWLLAGSSEIPRKEVIQPHLPVRLPCYDFTPITDPTLDACPPRGLAQRHQVLPTFVV